MKSTQDDLTEGLTIDVSGPSPEQDDECINRHAQDLQRLFAPRLQEGRGSTRAGLQSFLTPEVQEKIKSIEKRLEELGERQQECWKTLIGHGWFLSPDTPIEQLQLFTDSLGANAGGGKQDTIKSYFRERIDSIEIELSEAYPSRSQILHDAFEAHRAGKYTLSVPVFFCQTDGVWQERFGKNFFDPERQSTLQNCKKNTQLQYVAAMLTLLANNLTPLWITRGKRGSSFDALNRHQVLHGSVDYATEPNSLKAISLLDCFRGICRRVAQKKSRVPV